MAHAIPAALIILAVGAVVYFGILHIALKATVAAERKDKGRA